MGDQFGIIIHWGIYADPGYDDIKSARFRKLQNGSEWYYKRLTENNVFRPTSGHIETKEWHSNHYNNKDYFSFTINEMVDVKQWIKCAKESNAKYIILTAKHHDGYCLWPSKYALHHTNRNIIKDFCEEAKNQDIDYGIYYSWMEFDKGITKDFIKNTIKPQINELLKYKPKIWWFDGHWEIKTDFAQKEIASICKQLIKIGCRINDRIPVSHFENFDTECNILRVFEDRHIPVIKPETRWEHINTIGISWGFNSQQEKEDYKSGKELFDLYKKVVGMNGNFLLNIGPNHNGNIDENEMKSLKEFTKLYLTSDS